MAKVDNVNTTDMVAAIELGCRTMQNVFNADDGHCPFFSSQIRPLTQFAFSEFHGESHVPGRHLNALLTAEDVVGITLNENAVDHHRRAAFLSFSGAVPLPLNRPACDAAPTNFCPHNLREGLHALYALVKFRDDCKARELAERCIASVRALWQPDSGWDVRQLESLGLTYRPAEGLIHGIGRMLGPLVKYYRQTGHNPALELAHILKEKAIATGLSPGDKLDARKLGTNHIHSITCVTSSLAQFAELLGDAALMTHVKALYDNSFQQLRDEIGWSPESLTQDHSDHGEANNSGDLLETALILGRWGHSECYHDAERMLRCHLLPAQLRDISFIKDPPNPGGIDALRDVANRHLGAFGFPAPYGHLSLGEGRGNLSFNMDIVGGTVGSLCEAYRHIAATGSDGIAVNLHFDVENDAISVQSPYTHACLRMVPKISAALRVRLPPWVDGDQLRVEGYQGPMDRLSTRLQGHGSLCFPAVQAHQPIVVHYPLAENEIELSEDLHRQSIRVRLRGDAVIAMENFGAELTFFDSLESSR